MSDLTLVSARDPETGSLSDLVQLAAQTTTHIRDFVQKVNNSNLDDQIGWDQMAACNNYLGTLQQGVTPQEFTQATQSFLKNFRTGDTDAAGTRIFAGAEPGLEKIANAAQAFIDQFPAAGPPPPPPPTESTVLESTRDVAANYAGQLATLTTGKVKWGSEDDSDVWGTSPAKKAICNQYLEVLQQPIATPGKTPADGLTAQQFTQATQQFLQGIAAQNTPAATTDGQAMFDSQQKGLTDQIAANMADFVKQYPDASLPAAQNTVSQQAAPAVGVAAPKGPAAPAMTQ